MSSEIDRMTYYEDVKLQVKIGRMCPISEALIFDIWQRKSSGVNVMIAIFAILTIFRRKKWLFS
jgi:hypothetical protein